MAFDDAVGDPLARHVGEFGVHELGRVRPAHAHEVPVEPFARHPLQLAEQVQPGLVVRVAPVLLKQVPRQLVQERVPPEPVRVHEREVDALADHALDAHPRGADEVGREGHRRVVVELGGEPVVGELDAVPLHPREADLAGVALRGHRLDLHGLAGRLRLHDDGLAGEVERDAEHVGVLDVEEPGPVVEVVRLAPERASDDLLAQKLRAERPYAEHVGHGAGVPALAEHRDRHDAPHLFAEAAGHADGVHDLAQQVLVREPLGLPAVAGAFDDLAAEPVDLVGRGGAEVPAEGEARVELLAVDQQGAGPRQRRAVAVEVPEERQPALHEGARPVVVPAAEPGDVVVDQLRGRGVVADHDEAGRHPDARLAPLRERPLVVAVQRVQRGLQLRRKLQRVGRLPAALLGHVLADVLPELAEDRHLGAGDVVGDGHPRQLHDAALDGVHQREVARRPREQRALRVARAPQEERRRRQVDHALHPELPPDDLQPRDPDPRLLEVPLRLLQVFALEPALDRRVRLLAVAVVGLVVQDDEPLQAHQLGHHALQHLAVGLAGRDRRSAPLQERPPPGRQLEGLAALEGVVVRDDDAGLLEVAEHVGGHQLAARVVAVGVVRLQHAQPPSDGHAGGDDEEAAREPRAAGMPDGVHGLPRDQQGHHRRLAGPGGQLQGDAVQHRRLVGGGPAVGVLQVAEVILRRLAGPRRDLGQPDQRLDRLDLAEERPDVAEGVAAPVPQQARRLGRHAPGALGQAPPAVDGLTHAVDEPGQVVLLVVGRDRLRGLVGDQPQLLLVALPGLGDRRDVGRRSTAADDAVRGPVVLVELPVAPRVLVGRVQDRCLVEPVLRLGCVGPRGVGRWHAVLRDGAGCWC